MKIPTLKQVKELLAEAERMNPGPWVAHSIHVGEAAAAIAAAHPDLDEDSAYILGMLHDIGRREGRRGARHIVDGYNFLLNSGYEDAARISLTHSYPIKAVDSMMGKINSTEKEFAFVKKFLSEVDYSDYDRLIQLCDALAMPSGF